MAQVCPFFAKGTCRYGNQCKNIHPGQQTLAQAGGAQQPQGGFSMAPAPGFASSGGAPGNKKECENFKKGFCKFGDRCKFSHNIAGGAGFGAHTSTGFSAGPGGNFQQQSTGFAPNQPSQGGFNQQPTGFVNQSMPTGFGTASQQGFGTAPQHSFGNVNQPQPQGFGQPGFGVNHAQGNVRSKSKKGGNNNFINQQGFNQPNNYAPFGSAQPFSNQPANTQPIGFGAPTGFGPAPPTGFGTAPTGFGPQPSSTGFQPVATGFGTTQNQPGGGFAPQQTGFVQQQGQGGQRNRRQNTHSRQQGFGMNQPNQPFGVNPAQAVQGFGQSVAPGDFGVQQPNAGFGFTNQPQPNSFGVNQPNLSFFGQQPQQNFQQKQQPSGFVSGGSQPGFNQFAVGGIPGGQNTGGWQQQNDQARNPNTKPCRDWIRSGTCRFGNRCRFRHEQVATDSIADAEEPMTVEDAPPDYGFEEEGGAGGGLSTGSMETFAPSFAQPRTATLESAPPPIFEENVKVIDRKMKPAVKASGSTTTRITAVDADKETLKQKLGVEEYVAGILTKEQEIEAFTADAFELDHIPENLVVLYS